MRVDLLHLNRKMGRPHVKAKRRIFLSMLASFLVIGTLLPFIPVSATTCPTSGNNVTIAASCTLDYTGMPGGGRVLTGIDFVITAP